MPIYSYTKAKKGNKKSFLRMASLAMILLGFGIIIWTIMPIFTFQVLYAPKFGRLVQPVPEGIAKNLNREIHQVLGISVDYTRASSWFPKAAYIPSAPQESFYHLSINKLGIDKAQVRVGTDDLSQSLIHYTGPLPGENGGPVIFGHSTLSWLYNPADYRTIFARLPELEINDEISVFSDNITYKYRVLDMTIINPTDLSVLKQSFDRPYLTLITCVPPGTYLKRLVVKAILSEF